MTEPGRLADVAGYSPDLTLAQKVEVLETVDVEERLRLVLGWARDTLADLTLRERIKTDVEEGMEKTQREFLLRRQLESIRKELGELGEGDDDDPDDYRARAAKRDLPEPRSREAVEREVDRLERTSEQSPEHGWIRTWLDTVLELPWGVESEDRLDVAEAARILDEDHDGLDDVKERILEHLAVRKLQAERGLVPGGRPRGRAPSWPWWARRGWARPRSASRWPAPSGRSFVRVALGGVRDEAEIRGHRRTYVGAQPGRLVRALREAGTMNPVILLDEVDKLGADYRGDPSSALLEVLDPAQNHTFRDHYLEVDLDLSKVLFIATANVVDTIPGPLLDRMEVIRARRLHRGREGRHRPPPPGRPAAGAGRACAPTRSRSPTTPSRRSSPTTPGRPACDRSSASSGGCSARWPRKLASGERRRPGGGGRRRRAGLAGPPALLLRGGRPHGVPGVATGLAVTGAGGDVLFVEASVTDGPEGLTLTGQLGDVMKESAEIALSYVRSHADALGIDPGSFAGKRFHVHVPAGAVPKDGPSAGVTMTTALVSLLRDEPVRPVGGDDRRGHPPGPGAAHRRGQAEGAGRPPGRAHRGGAAGPQRPRPRGRARGGPRANDLPPGRRRSTRCWPRPSVRRPWRRPPDDRAGGAGRPLPSASGEDCRGRGAPMADDRQIIEQIGRLADEERRLEEAHAGEGLDARGQPAPG